MNFVKLTLIKIYHSKLLSYFIPTTVSCLQNEISDCNSVLDLGCGADSPLQYCRNISYSLGVDIYEPYLKQSRMKKIHTKYKKGRINEMKFGKNQFDAVILIDVLEHLDKKTGEKILKLAENWSRKKVIVVTPNGFIEQGEYDNNKFQKHRSGWGFQELFNIGYRCYGLAGFKFLRKARVEDSKDADLSTSIKYRPRLFWFFVASLSQILTYRFPKMAFSLFCVKRL